MHLLCQALEARIEELKDHSFIGISRRCRNSCAPCRRFAHTSLTQWAEAKHQPDAEKEVVVLPCRSNTYFIIFIDLYNTRRILTGSFMTYRSSLCGGRL